MYKQAFQNVISLQNCLALITFSHSHGWQNHSGDEKSFIGCKLKNLRNLKVSNFVIFQWEQVTNVQLVRQKKLAVSFSLVGSFHRALVICTLYKFCTLRTLYTHTHPGHRSLHLSSYFVLMAFKVYTYLQNLLSFGLLWSSDLKYGIFPSALQ
jgi:hypothetical protein